MRTLRAVERLPQLRPDSAAADGLHPVPTFAEVLALVRDAAQRYGRPVAVAAETKHPSYQDGIGLSLEEPLVADLRAAGLDGDARRVYVQSFEEANLRELRPVLPVRLVQLTRSGRTARPYDHVVSGDPQTYAAMSTRAGLREVAEYADVLAPSKVQVLPRTATDLAGPRRLVRDAHRAGLAVVPWTFRAENAFLAPRYRRGTDPAARGDLAAELRDAFRSGVDGVFTDSSDLAAAARRALLPHLRRTARSTSS